MLPRRFFAEVQTHLGSRVEADVAEFERLDEGEFEETLGNGPGGGVAVQTWAPPVATLTMPAVFPDASKSRSATNETMRGWSQWSNSSARATRTVRSPAGHSPSKSVAYLQRGIGLIVVDIVGDRHFNLHNELLPLLNLDASLGMTNDPPLYAIAYRPIHRGDSASSMPGRSSYPSVRYCRSCRSDCEDTRPSRSTWSRRTRKPVAAIEFSPGG